MEKNLRPAARILALVLFPLALAAMLPILFVFGTLLYVGGLVHAALQLAGVDRQPQTAFPGYLHHGPHFVNDAGAPAEHDRERRGLPSS
jgi:hypothetical protein